MAPKMKTREEEAATMEEDRLTNLPDDLKNRILSSLDLKEAVQTSVLSKSWVSTWTRIPVLKFQIPGLSSVEAFDEFVNKVFTLRDESAPLKRLSYERWGPCRPELLKKAFDFALTHSVQELKVEIDIAEDFSWPICLDVPSDSVTSLVLTSTMYNIGCPFLGSGSFKNLISLHLDGPIITDLESFTGFQSLESLTLLNYQIKTEGKILRVKAPNLATLVISSHYNESFNCCELTTPNLKIFAYEGSEFPRIQTHEALSVFDTLAIGFRGMDRMNEKRKFDDLMALFCVFHNARFVPLFFPMIALLTFYEDEMVKRISPFEKLNHLLLHFKGHQGWSADECSRIASNLKDYFLHNSPDAKFTMVNPDVDDDDV
ncbi:hypothetical protein LXL04_013290 [Taraxacum kok-saghyz]